jgi:Ca-activated chloride channel family protein
VTFDSPLALIALLAVPIAVAGYLLLDRRRRRLAGSFATPAMLPNVIDRAPGWRRHVPPAILLLAVAAFLVGFARPHLNLSVTSERATAILAVDTSRSMGATDVQPTRLAAAQASARRFLADVPAKYRVGVVAFASRAQVVAPPTQNREFVGDALSALRVGEGTALGDAIATGVRLSRTAGAAGNAGDEGPAPAAILVLSDGANMGGQVQPDEAIRRARAAHIPVFTALLGTQLGVVEVKHTGGYVERIQVPPDPDLLRRIARETGGRFFEAPRAEDLAAVYTDLKSRLGKTQKNVEVTVAFAAGAIALLLAGGGFSMLWFRRVP